SMAEVADRMIDTTKGDGAISFSVRALLAQRLMELASNTDADAHVRAEATEALRRMSATLDAKSRALREGIERCINRLDETRDVFQRSCHARAAPDGARVAH